MRTFYLSVPRSSGMAGDFLEVLAGDGDFHGVARCIE
jgi:hypothetical protein